MAQSTTALGAGLEATIIRNFRAPPALVFACFTDPDRLAQWWGPLGCENHIRTLDVRPGGEISMRMAGQGYDHVMGGEFVEIDPPRRLVFLSKAFEAPDGGWGIVNRNTLTFTEKDGGTELHLHVRVERAKGELVLGALGGMRAGWGQSLERLGDLVGGGGKTDIEVGEGQVAFRRAFDAPEDRVRLALARLDDAGAATVADDFTEEWGRSTLTRTLAYAGNDARDAALDGGLERKIAEGFDEVARALAHQ